MVKKVWNPDHQKAIDGAVNTGTMDKCLRAINRLQVTPYTINEWVLEAVEWIKAEKPENDLEKFPSLESRPNTKTYQKPWDNMSKDEQIAQVQLLKDARKNNLEVVAN